jgi:2-furoyl-CoA dehydrogenase large subunit
VKLQGRIEIRADPSAVWDLILDPRALAACVPGVQRVEQVDERTFRGEIAASVGPIDGRFTFTSTIREADFPSRLVVEMTGADSVTNSPLRGIVTVGIETPDPSLTVLAYVAVLTVGGRLAILGEVVLRGTAGLMINELAKCLRSRLEVA